MQPAAPRKTKIIATLGPATDSAEMIARLMEEGVNVLRLNMSHAPHDWVRRVVKDIRAIASELKVPVSDAPARAIAVLDDRKKLERELSDSTAR